MGMGRLFVLFGRTSYCVISTSQPIDLILLCFDIRAWMVPLSRAFKLMYIHHRKHCLASFEIQYPLL